MTILTLYNAPSALQAMANSLYNGATVRLGLITVANAIDPRLYETNLAAIYAAEYNPGGGYLRPSFTLPGIGVYDVASHSFIVSSNLEFLVTTPTAIDIAQIFVLIGGTTAPGNTTGLLNNFGTFLTPQSIPAVTPVPFGLPLVIK